MWDKVGGMGGGGGENEGLNSAYLHLEDSPRAGKEGGHRGDQGAVVRFIGLHSLNRLS